MRTTIKTAHNLFGFKISFDANEKTRSEIRDVVYEYWDNPKDFTSHQEISETDVSIGEYFCYGFANEKDARQVAKQLTATIKSKMALNDSQTTTTHKIG